MTIAPRLGLPDLGIGVGLRTVHYDHILRHPDISVGAKTVYAVLLSYAWHNDLCFPGQERLASDIGLTRVRVTHADLSQVKVRAAT